MAKYASFGYWTSPLQMVTINLETEATHLTTIPGGRGVIGKPAAWLPDSGKLILANDESAVIEYDPATQVVREIDNFPDIVAYVATISTDGRVFWGTYPDARVVEYNPATDAIIDHGPCNPDFGAPQYGYTIGVDPACTHVYIGPGQLPWYLAVLELATGEYTVYFENDMDTFGAVYTSVDRSEIWYRRITGGVSKYYTLIGGVVTESTDPRPSFLGPYNPANIDTGMAEWLARYNIEFDLSDALPTSATPDAVIRWREGEGAWNEVTISGIQLNAQILKRVYPYDADRLLCFSGSYGPAFLFNPTTGESELLGWTNRSLYDARRIGSKWYLNCYPSTSLEWDPAQPWTLTEGTIDRTTTNPRDIIQVHKYHFYSTEGPDGWLYLGVNHVRDSIGGDLGWFDPVTEAKGHLREGFEIWSPRGIVTVGDVLVYSGYSQNKETHPDGQLIIFDPDTKSIVDSITPLPGENIRDAGCIVAIGEDVVGATGTRAYRYTIATKTPVWIVDLPGLAFGTMYYYDRRMEVAPDGLIYLYLDNDIYTLNPTTGEAIKVRASTMPAGIFWHNGVGYIENGTDLRIV